MVDRDKHRFRAGHSPAASVPTSSEAEEPHSPLGIGTASMAVRRQECGRLLAMANAAMRGEGQVVGVCGAGGPDKSKLLATVAQHWARAGGMVHVARCRPSWQKRCLSPMLSLLSSLAGLSGSESAAERYQVLLKLLQTYDCEFSSNAHWLASLIASEHGGCSRPALPWRTIIDRIGRLIETRTQDAPVLFVIEEMQLADPCTIRLVTALSSVVDRGNILVLTSYRAGQVLGKLRRSLGQEIVLRHANAGK